MRRVPFLRVWHMLYTSFTPENFILRQNYSQPSNCYCWLLMPSTALTTWFLSSLTLEEREGQHRYSTFLFQAQSCRRLAFIFCIFLYKCFIHWDQFPGNLTVVLLHCQPPLARKVISAKWQQHPVLTQDFTGFNNINRHRSEATWRKKKKIKQQDYSKLSSTSVFILEIWCCGS